MRALGGEFGFYVFLMVLVCGRMVEGEDEFVCEEPNGGCNVGGISRILGDVVVIVWMVQLGDEIGNIMGSSPIEGCTWVVRPSLRA